MEMGLGGLSGVQARQQATAAATAPQQAWVNDSDKGLGQGAAATAPQQAAGRCHGTLAPTTAPAPREYVQARCVLRAGSAASLCAGGVLRRCCVRYPWAGRRLGRLSHASGRRLTRPAGRHRPPHEHRGEAAAGGACGPQPGHTKRRDAIRNGARAVRTRQAHVPGARVGAVRSAPTQPQPPSNEAASCPMGS
jgi:hypothetical protein